MILFRGLHKRRQNIKNVSFLILTNSHPVHFYLLLQLSSTHFSPFHFHYPSPSHQFPSVSIWSATAFSLDFFASTLDCLQSILHRAAKVILLKLRSDGFLVKSRQRLLIALRLESKLFSSVQFSSVAQSYPTLCDPMDCSTPGLPVHHQLQEFTQTHVH